VTHTRINTCSEVSRTSGPQYFLGGGFLLLLLLLDFATLSFTYHGADNNPAGAPAEEQAVVAASDFSDFTLVVLGETIPGGADWAFSDLYQIKPDASMLSSEGEVHPGMGAMQDHTNSMMDMHGFAGEVSGYEAFNQEWNQLLSLVGAAPKEGPSDSSIRLRRITTSGAFLIPVPGVVTSHFGEVRSRIKGLENSPHHGIDIAASTGTPVVASNSGVVVFSDAWTIRGNGVVIDHGQGAFTGYYHLSKLQVSPGQTVSKGQVLGTVGSTGLSTGPHLHWEVIVNGSHIEPLSWVKSTGNDQLDSLILAEASQEGVSPYHDRNLGESLPPMLVLAANESSLESESIVRSASTNQIPDESKEIAEAQSKAEAALKAEAKHKAQEERLAGIRKMYIDLLGREPDRITKAEIKTWDDTGLSLKELRPRIIEAGVQERITAIAKIYIDLLGRDPRGSDDESLLFWAKGKLTIEQVRQTIHTTGADERRAAVRKLYQTLLKRDPVRTDDAGLQSWVESALSIKTIRERLMASPEYKSRIPK